LPEQRAEAIAELQQFAAEHPDDHIAHALSILFPEAPPYVSPQPMPNLGPQGPENGPPAQDVPPPPPGPAHPEPAQP
jgi:hypothetical protein